MNELAEMWGWSSGTIRNLFKHDPDVLKLQGPGVFSKKRSYVSLRIPESIALRIYQRLKLPPTKLKLPHRELPKLYLHDRKVKAA